MKRTQEQGPGFGTRRRISLLLMSMQLSMPWQSLTMTISIQFTPRRQKFSAQQQNKNKKTKGHCRTIGLFLLKNSGREQIFNFIAKFAKPAITISAITRHRMRNLVWRSINQQPSIINRNGCPCPFTLSLSLLLRCILAFSFSLLPNGGGALWC